MKTINVKVKARQNEGIDSMIRRFNNAVLQDGIKLSTPPKWADLQKKWQMNGRLFFRFLSLLGDKDILEAWQLTDKGPFAFSSGKYSIFLSGVVGRP